MFQHPIEGTELYWAKNVIFWYGMFLPAFGIYIYIPSQISITRRLIDKHLGEGFVSDSGTNRFVWQAIKAVATGIVIFSAYTAADMAQDEASIRAIVIAQEHGVHLPNEVIRAILRCGT